MRGVGLTAKAFWRMTPREFEAHTKLVDLEREDRRTVTADFMAALYNGPATRRDKKPWTRNMFLPGYRADRSAERAEWKGGLQKAKDAAMEISAVRNKQPRDEKQAAETMNYYSDRAKRAAEARKRGESREVIERIMTGAA